MYNQNMCDAFEKARLYLYVRMSALLQGQEQTDKWSRTCFACLMGEVIYAQAIKIFGVFNRAVTLTTTRNKNETKSNASD